MEKMNQLWTLTDVLIAGRRLSGPAYGRSADEALRKFAAVEARKRGADIAAAVAGAKADRLKKIVPAEAEPAERAAADRLLPDPGNYADWPAMRRVGSF